MTKEERAAAAEGIMELKRRQEDSQRRVKEAADQILEVSRRLHLTWREFEKAIESVKYFGHIT